jgi:hypothetical protein
MNLPDPRDIPVELLAAHADQELDAPARAAVEKWLAAHPEHRAELESQEELSPKNSGLWDRAEPPEPSELAWNTVRLGIHRGLRPAPAGPARGASRRLAFWLLGGVGAAGIAAAVGWFVFGTLPEPADRIDTATKQQGVPADPNPLTGVAVLPVAGDEDVILDRVPELSSGLLPVGVHPVPGMLVLAARDEVDLEEVEPSNAWPAGGPKMTTGPGDAPMIYAAKPR